MSLHLDYLRHRLAAAKTWRQTLVKRYPADIRNQVAVDTLHLLASMSTESVSQAVAERLSAHHGPTLVESVQTACREVAFKYQPETLEDVALRVLQHLEPPPPAVDVDAFSEVTR